MARKIILYCFLFFFSWSITTCSLTPNELKTAEQLIETAPDSALHILQHLSPGRYKSDESRALYGLLMIRTLDKKLLPLKPDSLLDFSIAWYQEHPDKDRLATCYLYKGRTHKYEFQYDLAINCYLKAIDVLYNKDNYLLLARINSDIADIYLFQREFNKATQKYLESYKFYRKANNDQLAFYSLIYVGVSYSQAKNYKYAQRYFHKVYVQSTDSLIRGFAIQNIGINYYNSKKYDWALVYLQKAIHYPYIKNNRAVCYYFLADLFFDLNKPDSAMYYANSAFKFGPDIRTKRECYRILVNSANSLGDVSTLKKYMVLYQDCSDSIRKIDAQTKGSVIETIHSTKQEVEKKQSWLWYLGIVLLLVIIVSILLYIAKHRKSLKELEHNEENHQIQRADIRKEVLLKHRDALLRKIEDRKRAHTNEWKKSSLAEREQIDRKMYEELLHLNDINFFYEEMDTVLNNMVSKLQTRYQLNKKEIQWCCLYLLNVSNQDIMMLLGYSQEALKKMKHRLAKNKFEIDSLRELEAFLFRILTE